MYPFIQANVFVLNSKADSWQTGCILTSEPVTSNPYANGNCSAAPGWSACARAIASCTADQIENGVNPFSDYMQTSFLMTNKAKSQSAGQGGFISNCHTHCEAQGSGFDTFAVGGKTMVQAFTAWYQANLASGGKAPAAGNWFFDNDYDPNTATHQTNPTCPVSAQKIEGLWIE